MNPQIAYLYGLTAVLVLFASGVAYVIAHTRKDKRMQVFALIAACLGTWEIGTLTVVAGENDSLKKKVITLQAEVLATRLAVKMATDESRKHGSKPSIQYFDGPPESKGLRTGKIIITVDSTGPENLTKEFAILTGGIEEETTYALDVRGKLTEINKTSRDLKSLAQLMSQ